MVVPLTVTPGSVLLTIMLYATVTVEIKKIDMPTLRKRKLQLWRKPYTHKILNNDMKNIRTVKKQMPNESMRIQR